MTKQEFRQWLQGKFDEAVTAGEMSDCETDAGELWREIESEDLLDEIGVDLGVDLANHDFVFRLEDGLLASRFETGLESETVWFFAEGAVTSNLRDYSAGELDAALGRARVAVMDLERLLRG